MRNERRKPKYRIHKSFLVNFVVSQNNSCRLAWTSAIFPRRIFLNFNDHLIRLVLWPSFMFIQNTFSTDRLSERYAIDSFKLFFFSMHTEFCLTQFFEWISAQADQRYKTIAFCFDIHVKQNKIYIEEWNTRRKMSLK